jgi:class 3 adenylate cyclase/tetratricopeptide (TPR) repeat protein
VTVCSRCGRENPDDARFCNSCAAPLAGRESRREERKVVSVLFADIVGFTDRAERLDPEDVRALQEPYWEHLRLELQRHGGTVEKFIGDAVVAVFGAPFVHEDDPERAVRAALAIRAWAEDQEEIQLRIAVTTGEVLVRLSAEPLVGEGIVSGDVANTAARLESAAPANGVLVDEHTYRATSHVIEYRAREPVVVKGKTDPVAVWEAVEARSRFGVDIISHAGTPLIGRAREVELLRATLARVREEATPQLVTIVGVPGIGKSRLVYELMRAVGDDPDAIVTWRQGRSLPYGDGVTFWALAEMVKAQAGILETDDEAQAEAKLRHAVRELMRDDTEAAWMERHLRPLLGLGEVGVPSDASRDDASAAWRRFVEALAEQRPLVVVFEDLHWADDGLLDFVDGVVEWVRDVPLLIVGTARPELLERCPTWGGGKANATTLSLSPLSEEETRELVGGLLQKSPLPAEVQATLTAHAGGNALYAEQYVRMVVERGHDRELPLPETVHGIIAARLDGLSEPEKRVLQSGAVLGKVFWVGAVVATCGIDRDEVRMLLHGLERRELVQRARRSSVAGENEYAFRHVLVRDVAYGQIPRAVRAGSHARAAAWIESLGRVDDHAEMLAHHYGHALELVRAAGGSTDSIASPARIALRRAGDRALALSAFAAAAGYYEQALDLWPNDDLDRPRVLFDHARSLHATSAPIAADVLESARAALSELGDVERAAEADAFLADLWWQRGVKRLADEHLERAFKLIHERPASAAKARVLASLARFRMLADDDEGAMAVGREALSLAESFDLHELRAEILVTIGTARSGQHDAGGLREIEHGLRIALEHDALSVASRAYNNLAAALGVRGEMDRHYELLREAVGVAERLGSHANVRTALGQLAWGDLRHGEWDKALRFADEFIDECERGSPHRQHQGMYLLRAKIHVARDDIDAARADCARALTLARASHDRPWLIEALSNVLDVYAEAGLVDDARAVADEILLYRPTAAGYGEAVSKLARHAELLSLDETAIRNLVEPVHTFWRRFTELVLARDFEELARFCAGVRFRDLEAEARVRAAEALLQQERADDAREQLEQALAFYGSVGATLFIRRAEDIAARARTGQAEHTGVERGAVP